MKLEALFNIPHKIYANAKWKLTGKYLMQTVPNTSIPPHERAEFTLVPGDNIRLDGRIYHVVSHELGWKEDKKGRLWVFRYSIMEGYYTPPEWISIGKVSK